jgi:arylsulfatase A-like enzyme
MLSKLGGNTPNFSQFSNFFTKFENSISPATWTVPAHSSFFSGLYPNQHKLTQIDKQLPNNIKTIAEQLSEKGYINTILTQNPIVGLSKNQLNKGFHNYYNGKSIVPLHNLNNYNLIDKLMLSFKKKILSNSSTIYSEATNIFNYIFEILQFAKESENNFIFANLMLAHPPYSTESKTYNITNLEEKAIKKYSDMHLNPAFWTPNKISDVDLRNLNHIYCKQIYLIDHLFGRFFSRLFEKKLNNDTAIIITSDHGDNLGERGILNHVFDFSDFLLKVPLLIYAPNHQSNTVISQRISNRRIYHTILDMAGFSNKLSLISPDLFVEDYVFSIYEPINWGLSRLSEKQKAEIKKQNLDTNKIIAYYDDFKLITDFTNSPTLFNIKEDPFEIKNCHTNNTSVSNKLSQEARKLIESPNEYFSEKTEDILQDKMIFEHLKELGYIE